MTEFSSFTSTDCIIDRITDATTSLTTINSAPGVNSLVAFPTNLGMQKTLSVIFGSET